MRSREIAACCALATAILQMAAAYGQETAQGFTQSLGDGSVNLSLRYRYESVDQAGFAANANASTLRTRLTYTSAAFSDFSVSLEVDDLRPLGTDRYNSTRNGVTNRPVVADPKGTDLNQAWIRYSGFSDTAITLGRQRINHANQRFIGSVGWRQNEQTMDALEVAHSFSASTEARYTHISNVNRVFGPESGIPAGDLRSSSHLLDASFDLNASTRLTGYGHFLDFDDTASASNQTIGLRLNGTFDLSEQTAIPYIVEVAKQREFGDNPTDYDADYLFLEAGLSRSSYSVKLGYEILGGNGAAGEMFRTPLATLHAFQGWADKFLATPADGIEDQYISFSGRLGAINLSAVYHDFSADAGGASYGDEIDLSAGWSFSDNYSLLLKLARYQSDGFSTDTDKFWVMFSASF